MTFDCPICGYSGEFLPYGKVKRDNARCPNCSSLERHRGAFFVISKMLDNKDKTKILYINPEEALHKYLKDNPTCECTCIDVDPNNKYSDYVADIKKTLFPNETFDCVLCLHVLNKINDDVSAIEELKRITKKGGSILFDKPLLEKTVENVRNKKEPYYVPGKIYRTYGTDFLALLNTIGLDTELIDLSNSVDDIEKYNVADNLGYVVSVKNMD